jgi:ribosomal-protein-alanine N-acetyltransferase
MQTQNLQVSSAKLESLNQAYDLFCFHRSQPWSIDLFRQSFLQKFSMVLHDLPHDLPHNAQQSELSSQKYSLLGYVIVSNIFDEAEIEDICIHPQHRRQGMAQHLLVACINKLREAGISKIMLEVRQSNASAIKLYQQQGFVKIAQRANYYVDEDGSAESAFIFNLPLNK